MAKDWGAEIRVVSRRFLLVGHACMTGGIHASPDRLCRNLRTFDETFQAYRDWMRAGVQEFREEEDCRVLLGYCCAMNNIATGFYGNFQKFSEYMEADEQLRLQIEKRHRPYLDRQDWNPDYRDALLGHLLESIERIIKISEFTARERE